MHHPMMRPLSLKKGLDGRNALSAGIRYTLRKLAQFDGSAARKATYLLKVEMSC
jgi:hypothetical protein